MVFYGVLQRAIRPIGELAEFATRVAAKPGDVLKIRWRSREVRELGLAINWASQELADRMQDAQQKLSRLRSLLDTAADAIVGVAADGRIVTVNPAGERIFGHSAQAMLGEPLESFLTGMQPKRIREVLNEGDLISTTNTRIGQVEWQTAQRGGRSAFPVELLIGETHDDPEISFTCIVRDLSQAKQAEARLALYGRVVDCAVSGIMISHAQQFPQPIAHVNPAFTRITGYTATDALGLSANLLKGPNTDDEAQALIDSAMQTGEELTLTLHHHRQDGSPFYNKLSVSPVRDAAGEITHYISVIEDVSNQIEIKRKLIESTARLNATFNLSPDGFAVFDSQGTLVSSNPALLAMVGQMPDRCTLQGFDNWFRNLCEDQETYPSIFIELHETSRQVLVLSHPVRRVLERELRHNLRGSGETFLYFRDITHQFEVNRMKSEFLTTAAHELRTPLASIVGFTELMIHRRYSEEKQKDLLQTVHRQGTLLTNVVQDLLDLSRIEARQGKDFRIVPTSLVELIQNTLDGVANEDLGRAVCVGKLPQVQVMADPQKIQQALGNLLDNAFKYSLGEAQVALDVSLSENAEGGWACIAVSDQGVGMKPDQLARAFEYFYRADSSGHIPGTGLGLNLAKEIAEIHGSSVALESREGVGTVARLSLRLAPQALVGTAQDLAPAATEP
jgi:PAS domain S-box-containing protein